MWRTLILIFVLLIKIIFKQWCDFQRLHTFSIKMAAARFCPLLNSTEIKIFINLFGINFRKEWSPIVFVLLTLMYFDAMNANMIVKIGANLIFMMKSSKNYKNHCFFGLSQLLCKIQKNLSNKSCRPEIYTVSPNLCDPFWDVIEDKKLNRKSYFQNFVRAFVQTE